MKQDVSAADFPNVIRELPVANVLLMTTIPLEADLSLPHGRKWVVDQGCTCLVCQRARQDAAFAIDAAARAQEAAMVGPKPASSPAPERQHPYAEPGFRRLGGDFRVVAAVGTCQARTDVMVWSHRRQRYLKRYLRRRLGQRRVDGYLVDVFAFGTRS